MIEIFNKLIREGLTPNSFYVLYCIKEKIVVGTFVNKELECKRLQSDEWLSNSLEITSKSLIFITEIEGYFRKTKKKTAVDLLGKNFIDNIKNYNEIFPNKKLSSGKYARVNPKTLENAFRWFFENYDYSWDTIISATKKYVDEYSVRRYEYMRTSQYFIRKQNTDKTWDSDLATYCELINNGEDELIDYFKERVD
jgi:hypothetical protein